ncbi:Uncharacterised protein [Enterobacter cloacae]|nr:Uncharacterised protein [Enterobacter cloacae]
MIVAFGCAVPLRVGVVSSVVFPLVRLPVTVPTLSSMLAITGAFGIVVIGAITEVVIPALPALSVAKTISDSPPVCGGVRVALKFPLPSATAVPSTVPVLLVMVTVLPASAVPVTCVPLVITASPVGAAGGVRSTLIVIIGDGALVLPAASVAVAVKLCAPSVSVVLVCGSVQLPLASAVTVPTSVVPS